MSQRTRLMAEFPPVSTEKWEEVITADLKGAPYDKKLIWRTMEGFSVRPYYRAEDLKSIKYLDSKPGEFPYVRGSKKTGNWLVRQTIKVDCAKSANQEAKKILNLGVTSLGFVINDKEFTPSQLNELLSGIEITAVELAFSGCGAKNVALLFLDKVKADKCNADDVRATFGIDPLKRASVKGSMCKSGKCFDNIAELIVAAADYKHIRVVSIGGVLFNDCGADSVQELAFTLAMGHDYIVRLMEKGLGIDQIAPRMKFNMPIGGNYFMEIAKFRAARMLWATIIKAYNPTVSCSEKMRVNAVTSAYNQSIYDPYVNLLRGTTEAMSAAIGGVDSIEVLPFDAAWAEPTDFSSRIARNAQLLLKEESHFDQVVDPSAGSYYIENLTSAIADKAWELFKEVEAKGGYLEALRAGFVQESIKATAAKRDSNIATRRAILLGVNEFPNFTESITDRSIAEKSVKACGCGCGSEKEWEVLNPYRMAEAFEQLRLKTDLSGKKPIAFMLTCGALSFARARSQFASNFFGCAGIAPVDNTHFKSVGEGVKAALAASAPIVVVCASDDDYLTLAVEAYNGLKGKAIVVVAGEPACKAELQAAGITHFISVKSNVLETLKEYQAELGI